MAFQTNADQTNFTLFAVFSESIDTPLDQINTIIPQMQIVIIHYRAILYKSTATVDQYNTIVPHI